MGLSVPITRHQHTGHCHSSIDVNPHQQSLLVRQSLLLGAGQARFANHSGLDLPLALELAQLNSVAYCHAQNVLPWNCTRHALAAHPLADTGMSICQWYAAGAMCGRAKTLCVRSAPHPQRPSLPFLHAHAASRRLPKAVMDPPPVSLGCGLSDVAAAAAYPLKAEFTALEQPCACRCGRRAAGFLPEAVVFDLGWDLFGYAGYSPALAAMVVAFRGTDSHSLYNWAENMRYWRTDLHVPFPGGENALVHTGAALDHS